MTSRQVFGVPLVEMMRRNEDPREEVPWVLKRFVGFLSKFGLEVRLGHGTTGSGRREGVPCIPYPAAKI